MLAGLPVYTSAGYTITSAKGFVKMSSKKRKCAQNGEKEQVDRMKMSLQKRANNILTSQGHESDFT